MERHRFRPSYLVAGLVFMAVATLGMLDGLQLQVVDLRWLGPLLLVLLGIMLVVGTAARRRDRDASHVPAGAASGEGHTGLAAPQPTAPRSAGPHPVTPDPTPDAPVEAAGPDEAAPGAAGGAAADAVPSPPDEDRQEHPSADGPPPHPDR